MDMAPPGKLPSLIQDRLPQFRAASRLFRLFLQVENRRRHGGNLPIDGHASSLGAARSCRSQPGSNLSRQC
jgi:hypothetical protein